MTVDQQFDPSRYLSLVNGKEYLEVKWRLVWLRHEHPEASIDTELISHVDNEAVFRAKVNIPDGGSASGWGSEDAQGFGDYLEKAETKAIGRALAALGYGTQFCGDFDFGSAAGRVVDSPVEPTSINRTQVASDRLPGVADRRTGGADLGATDRQRGLIQALAREQKLGARALDQLAIETVGEPLAELSRKTTSAFIEILQARVPEAKA